MTPKRQKYLKRQQLKLDIPRYLTLWKQRLLRGYKDQSGLVDAKQNVRELIKIRDNININNKYPINFDSSLYE